MMFDCFVIGSYTMICSNSIQLFFFPLTQIPRHPASHVRVTITCALQKKNGCLVHDGAKDVPVQERITEEASEVVRILTQSTCQYLVRHVEVLFLLH